LSAWLATARDRKSLIGWLPAASSVGGIDEILEAGTLHLLVRDQSADTPVR